MISLASSLAFVVAVLMGRWELTVTMFNEKHLCMFKLDIAYFITSGAYLEIRLKYLKINK